MGLRGPGATRARKAREQAAKSKRRLPWKKKGLSRVQRIIAFIEWLPITKGRLAGKRFKLLPHQKQFIRDVYGPKAIKDRVSLAVYSEPRGNGKSGLASTLCLCHLLGPESEPRGEIYSAAIDAKQAGLIFSEMEAIILAVPEFAGVVNIQRFHKKIEVIDPDHAAFGSTYEALSQDARRGHGLSPTFWIYDELAQTRTRELLDNLRTALGKRKRSLGMVTSTQAASDEHPLSQLIDDAMSGADPSVVCRLLSAPEDADPYDEQTIRACNPAAGIFLDADQLLQEAARARRNPADRPAFRNLRLNQRVDANEDARLFTTEVWRSCAGEGAEVADPAELKAALKGRRCFGALDLSGKHDLTSLTLVFPDDQPEPVYDILSFFWTPADQLEGRKPLERRKLEEWIDQGWVESIPGPTIRYRWVARRLIELAAFFDIQLLAFDDWRIEDLKHDLAEEGGSDLPMEKFIQGRKSYGPAIEQTVECGLTGRLNHHDNPVLTSAVMNAIVEPVDAAGNLMILKDKSNKASVTRIDGAATLVMALGTAKRFETAAPPSVYEDRGLLTL